MMEITEVSVEFFAVAIRHLDEANGPRLASPALAKFADLLGQAEALFLTMPEVKSDG